jgi:hypothetical protein
MAFSTHLSNTYALSIGSYTLPGYTAVYTVILNLAVAIALTPLFNALGSRNSTDQTISGDYLA